MIDFAWTGPLALTLVKSVALLVVLLIFIAYVLYADRKIWAAAQLRRGPNVVGPWGLWQSFADMLKFVFKEPVIPDGANKGVFLLAPFVMGMLTLSAWAVIPLSEGWFDGQRVTCRYHGWEFEPCSGRCELIPSLTSHDRLYATRIYASAFACEERDGYA